MTDKATHNSNGLVFIASSPIHGQGLFAAQELTAGQLIGVYEGPIVEDDGMYVLWIEDEPGGGWTGYDGRNELRFMNHSDEPNAEMDGLRCYSLGIIQTGMEITIDYGWDDS